jgi:hypothetical protein
MKYSSIAVFVLALSFGFAAHAQSPIPGEPTGVSEWVFFNAEGKLEYKTTERGDRIMDFSHAGYMGGGVALPNLPVRRTVAPLADGADCTQLIQAAIDLVSALPVDENGFRGAVLLAPGEFPISNTINIHTSGVVLRGSVAENGDLRSTILMTPNRATPTANPSRYVAIRVAARQGGGPGAGGGQGQRQVQEPGGIAPFETTLADDYVPFGTRTFRVQNASGFEVGDRIELRKPVTEAWVEFVVMHNLIRDGNRQTWMPINSRINMLRRITDITGNQITVDVPLADSFDAQYLNPPGTIVAKLTRPSGLINQAGIEYLRIVSPEQPVSHTQSLYEAIRMNGEDLWVRRVQIYETMDSVRVNGHRITLQFVDIVRRARHVGSSRPAEFAPDGGQILIDRCTVTADNVWSIATGGRHMGPIVILNSTFRGRDSRAQGHQRWSTAKLYDNCYSPDGRMDFINRGMSGGGHGWGLAWSVMWNSHARAILVQEPPGTRNWAIGTVANRETAGRMNEGNAEYRATLPGGRLPEGTIDSHGVHVAPKSLYLTQLLERLGPEALRNIGY